MFYRDFKPSLYMGINKQFIFKFDINYYGISSDPSLGKNFLN